MSGGRLVAVVGPSGVGKDSVMAGIAAAAPGFRLVRRCITRAPGLGGEDYEPLTPAAFAARVASGGFCLHWEAHGLHYGIPAGVRDELAAVRAARHDGAHVVVEEAVVAHALHAQLVRGLSHVRAPVVAQRECGVPRDESDP